MPRSLRVWTRLSPQPPARGAARLCKVRKLKPRGYGDVTGSSPLGSGTTPESGCETHRRPRESRDTKHLSSPPPPGQEKARTPAHPGRVVTGDRLAPLPTPSLPQPSAPLLGPQFPAGNEGLQPGYPEGSDHVYESSAQPKEGPSRSPQGRHSCEQPWARSVERRTARGLGDQLTATLSPGRARRRGQGPRHSALCLRPPAPTPSLCL